MIGQTKLLEMMDTWIANGSVPRFLVITGPKLSGKKTLVHQLRYKLGAYIINCENSVESVRDAVKNCYKCDGTTLYVFADADKMSTAAKNALLKITEEPPRKAHFVLTAENPSNVLETLRSRAVNLTIQNYTKDELIQFSKNSCIENSDVVEFASTPGMMLQLNKLTNFKELLDFCEQVITNIQTVSGVNAFKIINRLKLKQDDEGFDPDMFFDVIEHLLYRNIFSGSLFPESTKNLYFNMLKLTKKYHRELQLTGVKKDSTLDMWILDMRDCKS